MRKRLNTYVAELHRRRFACEKSFFEIYGAIERVREHPRVNFQCPDAPSLTLADIRQRQALLDDFEELEHFMLATGLESSWFALKPRYPSPDFLAQLKEKLEDLNDMELELTDNRLAMAS